MRLRERESKKEEETKIEMLRNGSRESVTQQQQQQQQQQQSTAKLAWMDGFGHCSRSLCPLLSCAKCWSAGHTVFFFCSLL